MSQSCNGIIPLKLQPWPPYDGRAPREGKSQDLRAPSQVLFIEDLILRELQGCGSTTRTRRDATINHSDGAGLREQRESPRARPVYRSSGLGVRGSLRNDRRESAQLSSLAWWVQDSRCTEMLGQGQRWGPAWREPRPKKECAPGIPMRDILASGNWSGYC